MTNFEMRLGRALRAQDFDVRKASQETETANDKRCPCAGNRSLLPSGGEGPGMRERSCPANKAAVLAIFDARNAANQTVVRR
jgi:hypothetical protein